jgi:hypothetical protein
MTPDDIAKARSVIRSVDQFSTFLSKAQGIRFLAASKDKASGWAAALDEVDRLRKPIDDTPPDAPTTASTIEYARKYLADESEGNLTLTELQASCFATVLIRVSAARSQQAAKIEQLEAEIVVLRELEAKAALS